MNEAIEEVKVTNDRPLRNVLSSEADGRGSVDITTPEAWARKRASLEHVIGQYVGEPSPVGPPRSGFRVLEETQESDYRRLKISYEAAADDEIRAWLLIPPPERRKQGAALLCQHGTDPVAKDQQIGAGVKPGRDFARLLARQGYITLAPDHFCAGERQPDTLKPYDVAAFHERHPHWSAVGKTIWDGRRAVDILSELDEVDPARIGSVGHSLGGHGSFFLGAFDERLGAAVSSGGLCTWQGNKRRANWARETWYRYLPALQPVFSNDDPVPFELHEFAALMAPRPFLNISGLSDEMYGDNHTLGDVTLQLHALWNLLGHNEAFANFLFGGGHDVPSYSQALIVAWFDRWLTEESPVS